MNHSAVIFGFQEPDPTWIIIGVILVLLFLFVVVVVIGLIIFFVLRKRKKAQRAALAASGTPGLSPSVSTQMAEPMAAAPIPDYSPEPVAQSPEISAAMDAPAAVEAPPPVEEIRSDVAEVAPRPAPAPDLDFDPSRTVAITRENTVTIDYGNITFVSGVLAGQQFAVPVEGAYIGREASLSQIVVADPRISKRHLWIGVKDGFVKIVDQESRNGTFINDPRSERVTEATLQSGDTVILGESDVARFEYKS